MDVKSKTYDRETLYEEVWAEPVRTVAERYGVSDVALAKACRRLKVPLPGRGYWAKKKAGAASGRPPLPELSPEEQVHLAWTSVYRVEQRAQRGVPMSPPKETLDSEKLVVKVEERLVRAHPLVAEARALLRQPGRRVRFPAFPEKPCLDIDVSRGALARALRIMNALLKGLEAQGYEVENTSPKRETSYYNQSRLIPGVTRVRVCGHWINFGLAEGATRVEVHVPLDYAKAWGGYSIAQVREGTGEFSLFLMNAPSGLRKTWNDGKKQRVEDCLGSFVSYLPLVAKRMEEERIEAERRYQLRLEEERRWQEAETRRREEERRRKELSEALGKWRLARDIRSFVSEAREAALAMGEGEGLHPEAEERLSWAFRYAEGLDPISVFISPPEDLNEDE